MNTTNAPLSPEAALAVVLDVLRQAAAAHGIHEAEELVGVYDEQWPEWYADHIVANLAKAGYQLIGPPQ